MLPATHIHTPHHHTVLRPFIAVTFTSTSCPAVKKKLQGISKGKKYNLKRESKHENQTWEDFWNYQTGNLKQALMDKVDSMQEQKGDVSREMQSLKKNQKRDAKDQKHYNRNI